MPPNADHGSTCAICDREKSDARAEIRRLRALGVADDILAPAALKAMTKPDHDTEHHPSPNNSSEIP